jgi:hypothetical protein
MKDVTYISRDVHRKFFHQFMKFGAKVLYPMYVSTPRTVEELRECEREYSIAGFPGCIGSTDATHIPLEKQGSYVDAPSAPWPQVKSDDADVQFDLQSS